MKLGVKLCREGARLPQYATSGAACFDIYAVLSEPIWVTSKCPAIVPTGLKFDIPEGYFLAVHSRSGHGFKNDVRLANSTGIIDSDYTGELMIKLTRDKDDLDAFAVVHGDRIAQAMLMPVQQVELLEVEDVKETVRGDGGFGSTGK